MNKCMQSNESEIGRYNLDELLNDVAEMFNHSGSQFLSTSPSLGCLAIGSMDLLCHLFVP